MQIGCSAIARVFQSPMKILSPKRKLSLNNRRKEVVMHSDMHAEIWVATIEDSHVNIEIIDVLARVSLYKIFSKIEDVSSLRIYMLYEDEF